MNTTTSGLSPVYVDAARMPQLASSLRARCARAGLAVWRVLEAFGHARAVRELRTMQDRWEITDPERAAQMQGASRFLMANAPHR